MERGRGARAQRKGQEREGEIRNTAQFYKLPDGRVEGSDDEKGKIGRCKEWVWKAKRNAISRITRSMTMLLRRQEAFSARRESR
jgi:hypothetical protein